MAHGSPLRRLLPAVPLMLPLFVASLVAVDEASAAWTVVGAGLGVLGGVGGAVLVAHEERRWRREFHERSEGLLGVDGDALCRLLLGEAPPRIAALLDATQRGDWEALERVTNELRARCARLGDARLAPLRGTLEELSHACEVEAGDALTELAHCARIEYERLRDDLR